MTNARAPARALTQPPGITSVEAALRLSFAPELVDVNAADGNVGTGRTIACGGGSHFLGKANKVTCIDALPPCLILHFRVSWSCTE